MWQRMVLGVSLLVFLASTLWADQRNARQKFYDDNPWAFAVYKSRTTDSTFLNTLKLEYEPTDERLWSFEGGYTLNSQNPVSRFFNKIAVDAVEINFNYTDRDDRENRVTRDISEYIVMMMFRWSTFPWNKYVLTSFAIAEGLSYTTEVTADERRTLPKHDDGAGLLNYLAAEATFALPKLPELELILRLHHRSSVGGLFAEVGYGTNAVGMGLRYRF